MKFLISFILLLTVLNDRVRCFDINQMLAKLSPDVIQKFSTYLGNVKVGKDVDIPFPIPIENTYEFDQAEISLPGEVFSANVNISKGSVSGVSNFRLLDLNVSTTEPILQIDILFPLLILHAENYILDGNMYSALPIQGKGVAHFEIYNLEFYGTLYMKPSSVSNAVLFDKLENAGLHVDRIASRTEFDDNIDAIMSAMVEDLLADYVNRFNKYFIANYSDGVIQYINNIIEA